MRYRTLLFWLILSISVFMSLMEPGNHFWGKPGQSVTIDLAVKANAQKVLSPHGITGRLSIEYHPFQVWIYQFFLLLTADIAKIVFLKQSVIVLLSLTGLGILYRILRYPASPLLLYFYSPYCFLYSRELCDDTWLIPFSLLLVAAYAWFYARQTFSPLVCMALCMLVMMYIHPRAVIPITAMGAVFVIFESNWIKRHKRGMILLILGFLAALSPYIYYLSGQMGNSATFRMDLPSANSVGILLFPLLSGGMFFSYDMLQLASQTCLQKCWLPLEGIFFLSAFTLVSYLFIAAGIGFTAVGLLKKYRAGQAINLEDRLGAFALLGIFMFAVLFAMLQRLPPPDYHNGIWFCYFFFLWRTCKILFHKMTVKLFFFAYLVLMGMFWLNCLVLNNVAILGGNLFSPTTVRNACEVAEKIAGYSPQSEIVLQSSPKALEHRVTGFHERSKQAFLRFYYEKWCLHLKERASSLQLQGSNIFNYSLYMSLQPLMYLYRQQQKKEEDLPVGVLVVKKNYDPGRAGLEVIDDPDRVKTILNR